MHISQGNILGRVAQRTISTIRQKVVEHDFFYYSIGYSIIIRET